MGRHVRGSCVSPLSVSSPVFGDSILPLSHPSTPPGRSHPPRSVSVAHVPARASARLLDCVCGSLRFFRRVLKRVLQDRLLHFLTHPILVRTPRSRHPIAQPVRPVQPTVPADAVELLTDVDNDLVRPAPAPRLRPAVAGSASNALSSSGRWPSPPRGPSGLDNTQVTTTRAVGHRLLFRPDFR